MIYQLIPLGSYVCCPGFAWKKTKTHTNTTVLLIFKGRQKNDCHDAIPLCECMEKTFVF